jgi:hypothetical protein
MTGVECEDLGTIPHQFARALRTSGQVSLAIPQGRIEFSLNSNDTVRFNILGRARQDVTAAQIRFIEDLKN